MALVWLFIAAIQSIDKWNQSIIIKRAEKEKKKRKIIFESNEWMNLIKWFFQVISS